MGSGVSYREITVKSALTRVQGMPFAWSLNPYSGCERACVYCFAREYHARRGRDTGAGFDREIDVKINFPDLLARELRRLRKRETPSPQSRRAAARPSSRRGRSSSIRA